MRTGYKVNQAFLEKFGKTCAECGEEFEVKEEPYTETAWVYYKSEPLCECCDEDRREKDHYDY